jgi:hypothetical protein
MQESGNDILLTKFVFGGKGKGVDAAKLAVRRVLDELFDRVCHLRFCRFSQDGEGHLGFAGEFHGTILSTASRVMVRLKEMQSKSVRDLLSMVGPARGAGRMPRRDVPTKDPDGRYRSKASTSSAAFA